MPVTVRIPTPLRSLTGGQDQVQVEGKNIREVIESLDLAYSGFKERLYDDNGQVRRFVNIYLNDEDIRFMDNLDTAVQGGAEISIVPAIAGGADEVRKVYLTYPTELVKEPIIYRLGHEFRVVTNIRCATSADDIGLVALELKGEEEELDRALAYLRELGIRVEPIELDVIE